MLNLRLSIAIIAPSKLFLTRIKSRLAPGRRFRSSSDVATELKFPLRAQAFLLALAVSVFSGCNGMPSYQALFDTSPEAEGTGIVGAGVVRAVVIIATYQATERQRRIADQRARVAYAKLARQQASETAARATTKTRAQKTRKKLPRYIAVDTEPDARSKTGKSIMLWDTQAEEVVGNAVYDVESTPRPLETARFQTYSAEYVGVGL
jgi:hypothetical protein